MTRFPLDFIDPGASDDEPVKGVTNGDLRRWHDEAQELTQAHDDLDALYVPREQGGLKISVPGRIIMLSCRSGATTECPFELCPRPDDCFGGCKMRPSLATPSQDREAGA